MRDHEMPRESGQRAATCWSDTLSRTNYCNYTVVRSVIVLFSLIITVYGVFARSRPTTWRVLPRLIEEVLRMWTPSSRQAGSSKDTCGTCGKEVEPEQPAMECNVCEKWEHVGCLRRQDRIETELYEALITNQSKALLYCCTTCQRKGCIVKQMYKLQAELTVANEQRLASARAVDEARDLIAVLKADKARLQAEVDELRGLFFSKGTPCVYKAENITARTGKLNLTEVDAQESSVERISNNESRILSTVRSEDHSDVISSEDEETTEVVTTSFKHPKGFKELRFRVDKFSGDTKEVDFDVWLDDFLEATNDCGWNNADRAKWFSWFLSGPAKSTWQRTLKSTHKESWEEIVSVYRGQYGVHMDPRTAYQRCNELQYEQFKSVKGLVDAMRDYQRMAPQKLTDTVLESILWNKAPVKLQREVKEITDGSVQELLQQLLKAESVVGERERRALEGTPRHTRRDHGRANENNQDQHTERIRSGEPGKRTVRTDGKLNSKPEMGLQSVKCFKCSNLGHIAKDCPGKRQNQPTRRIVLSEETDGSQDPWLLMLSTEAMHKHQPDTVEPCLCTVTMSSDKPLAIKGPTYKAEVNVDGVSVRALLDHGAQVSLVRKELLPKIWEKNGWTLDQCHDRNCKLEGQPTGAGGHKLGATAVVRLHITPTDGEEQQVPCYVLESSKPIWNGELKNCAMVLGTNALEDLGFCIVTNKGRKVKPEGVAEPSG